MPSTCVHTLAHDPRRSMATPRAIPAAPAPAILDAAERLFAELGYDAHQPERGRRRGGRLAEAPRATSSAPRPTSTRRSSTAASPRCATRCAPAGPGRSPATGVGEDDPRRRRLRLLRLPRRPPQLRPPDRAGSAERGRPARGREPPLRRPGGARRHQRRAGSRRRALGRRGAAAAQRHRPLLVPPGPRAHRRAGGRRRLRARRTTSSAGSATSWTWWSTASADSPVRPVPSLPSLRAMTDLLTARPPAAAHADSPPSRKPARWRRRRARRSGRPRASSARCSRARSASAWSTRFPGWTRRKSKRPAPSWSGSSGFLRERVDSDRIDREGKIPPEVDRRTPPDRRLRHQDPEGVRRARPEPDGLHPRDRHGHQRGRQPHRPALRGAVHRRAPAAQDLRHPGAEEEVSAAAGEGRGERLRPHRVERGLRPRRDQHVRRSSRPTARTTSSTARSCGAPTGRSPS